MDGDWVLFEYASAAFLEHLKALENQSDALDSRLLVALNRFREIRFVGSLDISRVPKHVIYMFGKFADEPDVQSFLSLARYSHSKAQLGIPDEDAIMDSLVDPLRIFSARRKLRQGLEDIICQESNRRDDLERLYGGNVYHCDQPFCHAYRRGFESKELRDQHSKIHRRPHKCPEFNCLFTDIGFCDILELDRHIKTTHLPQISVEDIPGLAIPPDQPPRDTLRILQDAVALDQVDIVKQLLHEGTKFEDASGYLYYIILIAASKASTEILSDLLAYRGGQDSGESLDNMLAFALESENLPNIGFLLSLGADMSKIYNATFGSETRPAPLRRHELFMSNYTRALSLWSPSLMAYLIDECHIDLPVELEDPGRVFFYESLNTTEDQARERFNGIKKYIVWPEAYVQGVHRAAKNNYFLGAKICLENGGDPNWLPVVKADHVAHDEMTALELAMGNGSKECAQLVKLLLQHGADPEAGSFKVKKYSAMAKKIARWFGTTWEDMVGRIQAGEDLAILPRRSKRE